MTTCAAGSLAGVSSTTTLALGPSWLDPQTLISNVGLFGLVLVVFAESGLLVGFFLPGDSLLFTAGLLVASSETDALHLDQPLWLVLLLVAGAAIAGDQVGYLIGRTAGPAVFRRPDSRLFKQEYVDKTHEFFERHGGRAIILARFVPIVRTFTPVVAGVARMDYRTYLPFDVVGGLLWGVGMTLLGYWLGQVDFVRDHIELMAILIVLISVTPVVLELLRARRRVDAGPSGGTRV